MCECFGCKLACCCDDDVDVDDCASHFRPCRVQTHVVEQHSFDCDTDSDDDDDDDDDEGGALGGCAYFGCEDASVFFAVDVDEAVAEVLQCFHLLDL